MNHLRDTWNAVVESPVVIPTGLVIGLIAIVAVMMLRKFGAKTS